MTQPLDVTGLLVAWSNRDAEVGDRLVEAAAAEVRAPEPDPHQVRGGG
jgi:hypothetical protein